MFPDVTADYDFSLDTCEAGPVDFSDLSSTKADRIVSWNWDFGDGNMSTQQDPSHMYRDPGFKEVTLEVIDNNGCREENTQSFPYTPIPSDLAILPSIYITCLPGVVTFDNISEPIDSTYDVLWDFGDGSDGPETRQLNPTHVYEEPGEYTIMLSVTSPSGCTAVQTFNDFVEIRDGFEVDFEFTPERPTIQNNNVTFVGSSDEPGEFFWSFGDGDNGFGQTTIHTCLLYTSPSPRDQRGTRMPSSA